MNDIHYNPFQLRQGSSGPEQNSISRQQVQDNGEDRVPLCGTAVDCEKTKEEKLGRGKEKKCRRLVQSLGTN